MLLMTDGSIAHHCHGHTLKRNRAYGYVRDERMSSRSFMVRFYWNAEKPSQETMLARVDDGESVRRAVPSGIMDHADLAGMSWWHIVAALLSE